MISDLLSDWQGRLIAVVIVFVVALIPIGIYYAAKDHARWSAWCEGEGGRVKGVTKTSTGLSMDGKATPVTTTETTYYCLTDDGRVLDIR